MWEASLGTPRLVSFRPHHDAALMSHCAVASSRARGGRRGTRDVTSALCDAPPARQLQRRRRVAQQLHADRRVRGRLQPRWARPGSAHPRPLRARRWQRRHVVIRRSGTEIYGRPLSDRPDLHIHAVLTVSRRATPSAMSRKSGRFGRHTSRRLRRRCERGERTRGRRAEGGLAEATAAGSQRERGRRRGREEGNTGRAITRVIRTRPYAATSMRSVHRRRSARTQGGGGA